MKFVAIPFDQEHEYQLKDMNNQLKLAIRLAKVDAFNDNGQVYDKNGQAVKGSDIIKLVGYLVSGKGDPVGRDEILYHVAKASVEVHESIKVPTAKRKWITLI